MTNADMPEKKLHRYSAGLFEEIMETQTKNFLGEAETRIEIVKMEGGKSWPPPGTFCWGLTSRRLPFLMWREFDAITNRHANCNMNWAPRACFVLPSLFTGELLFVHVNWDVPLPWIARNIVLIPIGVLLVLSGWFFLMISPFGEKYPLLMFLGLPILAWPAFGVVRTMIPIRSLFLVDFFVRWAIWTGMIKPQVYCAPWQDLEGFEIGGIETVAWPNEKDFLYKGERRQIRALCGIRNSIAVVSDGTWPELYAREIHRTLQLHFVVDRRKYTNLYESHRQEVLESVRKSHEISARRLQSSVEVDECINEFKRLKKEAKELNRRWNRYVMQTGTIKSRRIRVWRRKHLSPWLIAWQKKRDNYYVEENQLIARMSQNLLEAKNLRLEVEEFVPKVTEMPFEEGQQITIEQLETSLKVFKMTEVIEQARLKKPGERS